MSGIMTNTKTCPVCDLAVDASRLARYPSARTCGVPACAKEHRRTQFNTIRKRYRDRRMANDPAFRLREKQKARERYVVGRLRLGKTPAERAPVAPEAGALDTFLAGIRMDALTAFLAPITWVRGLMRRRRERKIYEALRIILTRQRDMQR